MIDVHKFRELFTHYTKARDKLYSAMEARDIPLVRDAEHLYEKAQGQLLMWFVDNAETILQKLEQTESEYKP